MDPLALLGILAALLALAREQRAREDTLARGVRSEPALLAREIGGRLYTTDAAELLCDWPAFYGWRYLYRTSCGAFFFLAATREPPGWHWHLQPVRPEQARAAFIRNYKGSGLAAQTEFYFGSVEMA